MGLRTCSFLINFAFQIFFVFFSPLDTFGALNNHLSCGDDSGGLLCQLINRIQHYPHIVSLRAGGFYIYPTKVLRSIEASHENFYQQYPMDKSAVPLV